VPSNFNTKERTTRRRRPPKVIVKKEREVALEILLDVRASFHSVILTLIGLPKESSPKRKNGITGSQIYRREVDWDGVDDYSSWLNWWCFFPLVIARI